MRRASPLVLGLGLLAPQLVASLAIQARQVVTCFFSTAASTGDDCSSFAAEFALSVTELEGLNPGLSCPTLVAGQNYCVVGNVAAASTTPSSPSSTKQPTTPTTSSPVSTAATSSGPSPQMPSIVSNCNKYYQVASGDGCYSIEQAEDITSAEFLAWNGDVDSACDNLWLGYYVCVGVSTATSTTTPATTPITTSTPTGPSPQMPSITSTCNKYYQVVSGDGCDSIETAEDITSAEFLAWNSYVDATCDNLWLGYYVCVGVSTGTKTTTPATTSTATATSTGPSPQMPSITSTCDKYYQVESGDGCYSIEQTEDITSTEFLAWNSYVDAACDNLWLGYYVCVGVS